MCSLCKWCLKTNYKLNPMLRITEATHPLMQSIWCHRYTYLDFLDEIESGKKERDESEGVRVNNIT